MSRVFGAAPRPSTGRAAAAALAVAALALTAACGDNGGKGGSSGSGGGAAIALPTNKATGAPITVGLINDDTSPLGSYADISKSARAAVSYVNDSLGGVKGRPIKLAVCTPNGSAAASANCAAELLRQKPAAVLGGLDLGADGSVPALAKAGIPYVPSSPIGAVEFTSPNSFSMLGGAPGSVSAGSVYVADKLKPKKVAVMFNDNPQARLAAQGYAQKVLQGKGVANVAMVAFGNNETDLTGPVSQAIKGGTDVVIGIMQGSGCANVIKAKQSLGSTAKFLFPGSCADPQVLKAAGPGAEGTYYAVQQLLPGSGDPDVAAFEAALAKYDKSIPESGFAQGVFGTVVTLSKVMATASAPDQPKAVTDALKRTANLKSFMGPTVTCDGKQLAGLAAFCTKQARIAQYKNGKLSDAGGEWFSA
ncbi:ABC transporter substrate-binding protein [Spirillospora sp. NPDC000708]